jgi:fucose permease
MKQNRLSVPLVAITFGNMALLGFLNSMRGVSFPLIKTGFDASYNEMGLLSALASFSTVCFSIIAGVFMNRYGLKKDIMAAFFFTIVGAVLLYFASSFWMALGLYIFLVAGFGFFEIGLNGMGIRIFTVRSGLMMNLLHFFYGVGAIFGPRFMGSLVNSGLRWQDVYPLAVIPVIIFLVISLFIRFPEENSEENNEVSVEKASFWTMLKDPMVWLFGLILGFGGSIEGCSVTWSGLYFFDVYGLDPSTTGAAIISIFYLLYTLSRFISGFIIEKTGYMRSVIAAGLAIILLFAGTFGLGRNGIYLLPVSGFFIAIIWPTVLAIGSGYFKERAQTASSAIICISFTLGGIINYGIGLTNRYIGEAWGYRTCLIYGVILVCLLLRLRRITEARR